MFDINNVSVGKNRYGGANIGTKNHFFTSYMKKKSERLAIFVEYEEKTFVLSLRGHGYGHRRPQFLVQHHTGTGSSVLPTTRSLWTMTGNSTRKRSNPTSSKNPIPT